MAHAPQAVVAPGRAEVERFFGTVLLPPVLKCHDICTAVHARHARRPLRAKRGAPERRLHDPIFDL
jgi:hypothetical protein